VKAAAAGFAAAVLDRPPGEELDRLAVVTFANGWEAGMNGTRVLMGGNWTKDLSEALNPSDGIPSKKVYDPGTICPLNGFGCGEEVGSACPPTVDDIPTGPCTLVGINHSVVPTVYPFMGYHCARLWDIDTGDGDRWSGVDSAISACTTTDTGGGLNRAAGQFLVEQRTDALRVVILLADGPANATFALESDVTPGGGTGLLYPPLDPVDFVPNLPLGFCPDGTWVGRGWPLPAGNPNRMFCQDGLVDTHHVLATEPDQYDADDFARDQAKLVACAASGTPNPSCTGLFGEDALIFTIGLGDEITDLLDDNPIVPDRKPYGASLLRYIAALGDDGDAATDPCNTEPDYSASCGNYYYAPGGGDLAGIFEDIYGRIASLLVPAPFSKLGPADGAYAVTGPVLSWNGTVNASGYEYCFDTTDDDACDGSWTDAGAATSAGLAGLTAGSTYYWQVRAVSTAGSTDADSGDWWSFTALPVSFGDVPATHWAWSWIERLFAAGIAGGCGGGNYCPNNPVTRAEMAVFLERGIHGPSYTPPAASGIVFGDVPASHWAAAWIEALYADGITGGCGGGDFCPNAPATRAEMAILLLRAKYGSSYTPPAAGGTVFGDVPASHWAAAWIEQLAAEGITGGCGGGNYCPNNPVTRAEMAVFLVRTFELP
jgi:hypothetical protein